MDPETQVVPTCPHCQTPIEATAFYCPTCGKKVREQPVSTSVMSQIALYVASFIFPPINLIWAVKYLKTPDPKARKIGIISLVITAIALIVGIWISLFLFKSINQQITGQMQLYGL